MVFIDRLTALWRWIDYRRMRFVRWMNRKKTRRAMEWLKAELARDGEDGTN